MFSGSFNRFSSHVEGKMGAETHPFPRGLEGGRGRGSGGGGRAVRPLNKFVVFFLNFLATLTVCNEQV